MSVPVVLGVTAVESNVPAIALYTSESEFIVDAGVPEGVKLPARARETVANIEKTATKRTRGKIFFLRSRTNFSPLPIRIITYIIADSSSFLCESRQKEQH